MKIKMNELNKKELQEVTNLYVKERDNFCWLISIEEFVKDYVRKCDACGKFVVVEDADDQLLEDTTWRCEHIHVCRECYEEEHKEYEVE